MSSAVLALRAVCIVIFPCLILFSCSFGRSQCEALKNPVLLFDGGSVVFELETSRMGQVFLMISPRREIDPETGALLGHDGFFLYCVERNDRGGYDNKTDLQADSEMEAAILETLSKCRNYFDSRHDPWARKAEQLVRMIQTREGGPPDATEWSR